MGKYKSICAILLLIALALFAGCGFSENNAEVNDVTKPGRLLSFSYSYSTFHYRPFEYAIAREVDKDGAEQIRFTAGGYSDGLISINTEIEETVLEDIARILTDENVFAWDGFKKYNQEVRDGFSFSLHAKFENAGIRASGYVERPENFKEGHAKLSEYLFNLTESFRSEDSR